MRLAVILQDIRSVHNVGSIFRTADAAGVEKIYCCGITPGPLDRFKKVRADFAKVSLGAEKSVAWESAKDIAEVMVVLKKDGWKIFAVEQSEKSVPYYEGLSDFHAEISVAVAASQNIAQDIKIALVMGNEVGGVSPGVLKLADKILEIPMRGKKESLNVSVAFGIVAFGLVHRHK